jgi:hypothetical protein
MSDDAQTFRTVLRVQARGRRELALPFDPAEVWGRRDRYHVTGTIDCNPFAAVVVRGRSWVSPWELSGARTLASWSRPR